VLLKRLSTGGKFADDTGKFLHCFSILLSLRSEEDFMMKFCQIYYLCFHKYIRSAKSIQLSILAIPLAVLSFFFFFSF